MTLATELIYWSKECEGCLHRKLFVCYKDPFIHLLAQKWDIPDKCQIKDEIQQGRLI
jgi:hypothetical protein